MKKLLKILVGAIILFSISTNTAKAYDFSVVNSDGNTLYYKITSSTNHTVKVTSQNISDPYYNSDYSISGAVTIPSSVTYNGTTYSVTSIGDNAFYNCTGLTSITIPNSVTWIGNEAFYDCTGLTSITIPNSVTGIGNHAFYHCTGLTSITIGNSVTSIGHHAFYHCTGLTSITIPNSVTSMGVGAFYGCTGLTSITIPNSVTSIDVGAFYGCTGLTSITIPNSVTSMGDYAFYYCTGLTSITIPNSVTSMGDYAFYYCTGLTSITIGNSVTSIGHHAFDGCTGLTSITIPNSVTSIAGSAFAFCTGLTSIINMRTIPPSISTGNYSPFYNVSSTIHVYVPCSSVSTYQSSNWGYTFSNIRGYTADTINAMYLGQPYTQNGFNVSQAGMYYIKIDTPLAMTGNCYNATILNLYYLAETDSATNITQTKAKLNAYLYNPSLATIKGFQYKINGSTNNYTTINGLMSLTDTTSMYYNLTNLIPNTTYKYRAFAMLSNGDTLFGAIKTFITSPITIATNTAANITQTKATLNASLYANGIILMSKGFQYKQNYTTNNYTTVNGLISSTDTTAMYYNLTNLIPNTTYQYRTFAKLSNGDTLFGAIHTFNTLSITIIINNATDITQTKAKLNSTIAFGDAIIIAKGFQYKINNNTTNNYTNVNGVISSTDTTTMYYNLTNLIPNTTYQYRAFAKLSNGDTLFGYYYNYNYNYENIRTFTTLPVTITTDSATNLTRTQAKLNSAITFGDAIITVKGFQYKTNDTISNYTTISGLISSTDTTAMYANLTNLLPFTNYKYIAFAVLSSGDTLYGNVVNFKTFAFNKDTNNNYLINDTNELRLLSVAINTDYTTYKGANYKLMNDIYLDSNEVNNITSIGHYPDKPFMGTFNGNNHIIYNINIYKEQDSCQGLFSYTENAGIYNLGIANINVISRKYTGGMVGYANNSYISNCYVNGGNLYATSYSGGLMGYQTAGDNSTITGCYNTCTVQGNNYIGGLLGYSSHGVVKNSYVAAPIVGMGTTAIGAIIGGAADVLTYHLYFSTAVTGQTQAIGEVTSAKTGEGLADSTMQTQDFVNLLNQNLQTPLWKMDYAGNNINNGFPILIWQEGTSGINDITTNNNLSVLLYPNPAQNKVTLAVNGNKEKAEIFIYDLQGRVIKKLLLSQGQEEISFDVSNFSKGVYNVRIVNSNNNITKKLIIQ